MPPPPSRCEPLGRPPTGLVWADGGSQIDFYDQDEQVGLAVDAVDAHFRTHLAAS